MVLVSELQWCVAPGGSGSGGGLKAGQRTTSWRLWNSTTIRGSGRVDDIQNLGEQGCAGCFWTMGETMGGMSACFGS